MAAIHYRGVQGPAPVFSRIRQPLRPWLRLLGLLWLVAGRAEAADAFPPVVEPVTGIAFPAEIRFAGDAEEHVLRLSGVAARTKWFFRVYAVAHYLPPRPDSEAWDRARVLADGPAKQLTVQYARDVPAQKITDVLREDFRLNATAAEYREIEPLVERMLAYFTGTVRKGDVFAMRWLGGGRVQLLLNDRRLGTVEDERFARTLWAIWFGEHAVVDPAALLQRAP